MKSIKYNKFEYFLNAVYYGMWLNEVKTQKKINQILAPIMCFLLKPLTKILLHFKIVKPEDSNIRENVKKAAPFFMIPKIDFVLE